MNKLFNINASLEVLKEIGLKIGADVPYCIEGGTALCEGIGEIITPLKPFENKILVVLKPNFGVSTKEVYTNLDINKIRKHVNIESLIQAMENDDLDYVSKKYEKCFRKCNSKEAYYIKKYKRRHEKKWSIRCNDEWKWTYCICFFLMIC